MPLPFLTISGLVVTLIFEPMTFKT